MEKGETHWLSIALRKTGHTYRITRELQALGPVDLSYFTSTKQKGEELELIFFIGGTKHKAVSLTGLTEELMLRSHSGRKSVMKV